MSSQWLNGEDVLADLDQLNEFYVKPFTEKKKDPICFYDEKSKKILPATGSWGRGRNIGSDSDEDQPQVYCGRGSSLYGRRSPLKIDNDTQNEIKHNLLMACGNGYSNSLDEEYWLKKQGNTNNNTVNMVSRKTTYSYKPKSLCFDTNSTETINSDPEYQKTLDSTIQKSRLNVNAAEFVSHQYKDSLLKKNVNNDGLTENKEVNKYSKMLNQFESNADSSNVFDTKLQSDNSVNGISSNSTVEEIKYCGGH